MINTSFDLSIWLKIETEENIDLITNIVNLTPTDSIKKGERKSIVLDEAKNNIWMYGVKHRDCKSFDGVLCEFFEGIPQFFQKRESLKKMGRVTIRISVISDFAQIGFTLAEKDLAILNCLQIPLEISVFSWGQAQLDNQEKTGDERQGTVPCLDKKKTGDGSLS